MKGLATYYVLFFIQLETRRVTLGSITQHPTALRDVDATLIVESPACTAPAVVVSRGLVEKASIGVNRLAALSIAPG